MGNCIAKLLNCFIANKRGDNSTIQQYNNRKTAGFTLVELLIVIAVVGVLSAGVLVSINVVSIITRANLSKAKTFAAGVENSLAISQVGKWSFEEGSGITAKDTSGYRNNGTLIGPLLPLPTWKTSTECGLGLGGCLSFDGVDDYVNAGNGTSLDINDSITIEAWVKRAVTGAGQTYIYRWYYYAGNKRGGYSVWIQANNKIRASFGSDDYQVNMDSTATIDTEWHHIAITRTANTGKIYIDGALDTTQGSMAAWYSSPDSNFEIGYHGGSGTFNGLIDEVQIYNQALTAYNVQQLYARGLLKHGLAYANNK